MQKITVSRAMPVLRTILAVSVVAAGLSGCASNQPMKIALTEMGTTSDSEYGAYGLRMMRSINVTGLGPEEVVGTMTTDPDKWSIREQLAKLSPVRNDLPDSMTPRITSGPSKIVERRFCKKNGDQCVDQATIDACNKTPAGPLCKDIVTIKDLTDLRDKLQNYQLKIAEIAHLEVKNEVLAAAKIALADSKSDKDGILKALQALYPEDNLEKAANVINAPIIATSPEKLLSDQLDNIQKILSKPGIIVTNWERETAFSGSANVADAQGAVSNTRKVNGFLILGEPRITSLQLGDDLVKRRDENNQKNGADSLFKIHRNYITYYQLRAKYVVFAETYHSAFRASLQADIIAIVQKLSPLLNAKISLDKLNNIQAKVDVLYAAITAASESGVLDASSGYVKTHDFSFERDHQIEESVKAEMERSEDTLPIISIRATLDDFVRNTAPQTGGNKQNELQF